MRNSNLAFNLAALVVGMLMLAYASVPLYRLFCQVTGYGGTTQESKHAPDRVYDRSFTVDFNADTAPGLPWHFAPGEHSIRINVGQQAMTHFIAENLTNKPITGRAVYNVLPFSAGAYFNKIQCFCFTEQTLAPHQRVSMPVLFFIDPAILTDPDMKNVKTITLSYTFFLSPRLSRGPAPR
jgi:cytochrome c oxidase assembly protein subunit 11